MKKPIETYGFRVHGVDLKDHKIYTEKNPTKTVEKEYRMSCLYLHRDLQDVCGYDICMVDGEKIKALKRTINLNQNA